MRDTHIIPVTDDARQHDMSGGCPCLPARVTQEDGSLVFVHCPVNIRHVIEKIVQI
jgi:hypothetical protein